MLIIQTYFFICLPILKLKENNSVNNSVIIVIPLKKKKIFPFLYIFFFLRNKMFYKPKVKYYILGNTEEKIIEHHIQKTPTKGDSLLPTILVAGMLCKICTVISPMGDMALNLMATSHLPRSTFLTYSHYFHLKPSYKFITDS